MPTETSTHRPAGYAAWTTDQLTTGIEALATWVLDRSATGPVDPSTFATIQAMATERAAR